MPGEPKLLVRLKLGGEQVVALRGQPIAIGRGVGQDVRLSDRKISSAHALLEPHPGGYRIRDLGSTNGTYVNGRKVGEPRAVRRSDRIYVGDYILMLEGDDEAIAPVQRSEIIVAGNEGHPQVRAVAVPPPSRDQGEALPAEDASATLSQLIDDDSDLLTSARRVAPISTRISKARRSRLRV